ncbi:MAG: hypothetical protein WKG01_39240 [Kofleriaceae bacterium]
MTAIHVLLVVAFLEVAISRIMVMRTTTTLPMLSPPAGPPLWYTLLEYLALFLSYFVGTLAVAVTVARAVSALEKRRGVRDLVAHAVLAAAAVVTAIPLVIDTSPTMTVVIAIGFALALIAVVANVFEGHRDLGIQIGLPFVIIPLLLHVANVIGLRYMWPDEVFDGPSQDLERLGVMALALVALATPYWFAPRPFARAVVKPFPIVVAMTIAAVGAVLARIAYPQVAKAASLALGVDMAAGHADPRLALYLLAIATLVWTLASCALAESAARRTVGAGISLVVLGGYAFKWPHHWLLPLLGVALIAEAARTVRDEELDAMPIANRTPPIQDSTWSTFVGTIVQALRKRLADVHSLTTRGEGGLASSVIIGDINGMSVRTRIDRIDGCVLALDVVVGREIDEVRGATLTLWAVPERGTGTNPPGPPAAPLFKLDDEEVDSRFRLRGNVAAFHELFDDDLRGRAVGTLDGWVAYWEREGLRFRVYPGRGASIDHPMPLSDLAQGKVPPNDRLIAVIELMIDLGERVLQRVPAPVPEPADLGEPA